MQDTDVTHGSEDGATLLEALWEPRLDPLFWRSVRTGVTSAWSMHVPFAHWIVAAHQPRSLVELGTHNGVSYSAFCEAVQRSRIDCRCLAVDTWRGDEHAGFYGDDVLDSLRTFHDLRYAGFSELLQATFDDALDYVPDASIDLLHIDGLHTYDAVRHDFEQWTPKLTDRAVILFHDTNVRANDFGVWRFFKDLAGLYPSFEFLHGHGLGLIAAGRNCGAAVLALTALSGPHANTVRERFCLLGERWDAEMQSVMRRQAWLRESGEMAQRRHELAVRGNALEVELAAARARADHAVAEAAGGAGALAAALAAGAAELAASKLQAQADADAAAEAFRAEAARALAAAVDGLKAEATRRDVQQRRLRAAAAERSTEARIEAIASHTLAQSLLVRTAAAEATVSAALAVAERDRTRAAAAESEASRLRTDVLSAQAACRAVAAERDRLLTSTLWRATWPVRAGAGLVPGPVRRGGRKGLTAGWWAVTGQLGSRLRTRRAILADTRTLAASPLFDAGWYAATNTDVQASGIDPALHYATVGGPQQRDPGPRFSAARYLARHPDAAVAGRPALLHFLERGQDGDWAPQVPPPPEPTPLAAVEPVPLAAVEAPAPKPIPVLQPPQQPPPPAAEPAVPTLAALLHERFSALEPLRTFSAPHDKARVTIVTDSINAGSLYGGVGTALILAVLLAKRLGAGLRLVTRTEPPEGSNIGAVLGVHGIEWDGNVELVFAPPGSGRDVPVGPHDIFLTTSWWTTWATRRAVNPARIVYLLQEDERGFYPLGDDQLRCTETLSDPALFYVVNSGLLIGHLQADGLAPGGVAFEPAFPSATYHREEREAGGKRGFFFYARPHNPRNLYWRGLEAVGAAIEEGVLDPAAWNFHFVGKAAHDMVLPTGIRPILVHNLPWADYAGLVRRMDVGLSLMDTPHPSYPPLDLAASGAVVVTNRFGAKTSLRPYSANILTVEATVAGLVEGLRQAVALSRDDTARSTNFAANGLLRDWRTAFAPTLDRLAERFGP